MCVSVCACVRARARECVCVCARARSHVYAFVRAEMRGCVCACVRARARECVCVCARARSHVYAFVRAEMRGCVSVCVRARARECVCARALVCMPLCLDVCVCVSVCTSLLCLCMRETERGGDMCRAWEGVGGGGGRVCSRACRCVRVCKRERVRVHIGKCNVCVFKITFSYVRTAIDCFYVFCTNVCSCTFIVLMLAVVTTFLLGL